MYKSNEWVLVVLRVAAGAVTLAHGIKHARARVKTSGWFDSIGFWMPGLRWFASTHTRIGVGVFLLAGFATSVAASGLAGVLVVAIWTVHPSAGFWVTERFDEGWEHVMVLAGVGLAIAIGGPGALSADSASGIDKVLDGWVGLALVAGGVAVAAAQMATFFRSRINAEA